MTARPMLFSAPMIRALLDGSKAQTRRVVKPPRGFRCPGASNHWSDVDWKGDKESGQLAWLVRGDAGSFRWLPCPYGKPGDRLWCRETFFAYGRWETRFNAKKERDEWHFIDMTLECGHQYLYEPPVGWKKPNRAGVLPAWHRRPAIHMPRIASRILLEITEVRVERLLDISEADALAEGCQPLAKNNPHRQTYRAGYEALWEDINGPGSWDANPWVWVISFKVIKP